MQHRSLSHLVQNEGGGWKSGEFKIEYIQETACLVGPVPVQSISNAKEGLWKPFASGREYRKWERCIVR